MLCDRADQAGTIWRLTNLALERRLLVIADREDPRDCSRPLTFDSLCAKVGRASRSVPFH